ncbi:hypothetical protein [Streptomyces sp. NPDC058671]|uniref:hypothetical protein n=1 Tax=Streptomyces sp. NPDC058671 TaxID=3346590 RepID=UPI0036554B5F
MAPGEHIPDPRGARTPAEFLARLQALKDWSGLTYRELTARAEAHGDVLPRSTVANMLARPTLPREELLLSFVRACGVDPAGAEDWRTVRRELARRGTYAPVAEDPAADRPRPPAGPADDSAPPDPSAGPADDATSPRPHDPPAGPSDASAPPPAWPSAAAPPAARPGASSRIRRALVATVAVAGLVLAGASVVAVLRDGATGPAGPPPRTPTAPAAPVAGDVRIRVVGSDFCLGERRGVRTGQVHQVPCAEAGFPLYSLAPVGAGRWRIVSHHPDFGPGCSGIPSGGRIPDAAYEDSECGDPSRVEAFALEPYGTPLRGHRIVPVGSATPGSCVTVVGDRTAAWARLAQAPCAPDATGQLFAFERRP